jgi:hypothetical protein
LHIDFEETSLIVSLTYNSVGTAPQAFEGLQVFVEQYAEVGLLAAMENLF